MNPLIQKTITMPCHPKFLNEVRTLMNETLAGLSISRRDKDLLVLAVDEAVTSVVQYARHKGFQNEVTLSVDVDDVRFKAVLMDSLNVFDLNGAAASDAALAERVATEKPFTMSISLIRQIMDEISYVYRKGFENELTLIKFL